MKGVGLVIGLDAGLGERSGGKNGLVIHTWYGVERFRDTKNPEDGGGEGSMDKRPSSFNIWWDKKEKQKNNKRGSQGEWGGAVPHVLTRAVFKCHWLGPGHSGQFGR